MVSTPGFPTSLDQAKNSSLCSFPCSSTASSGARPSNRLHWSRVHPWRRIPIIIGIVAIGSDGEGECRVTDVCYVCADPRARLPHAASVQIPASVGSPWSSAWLRAAAARCRADRVSPTYTIPSSHADGHGHITPIHETQILAGCSTAATGPATTFVLCPVQAAAPNPRLPFACFNPARLPASCEPPSLSTTTRAWHHPPHLARLSEAQSVSCCHYYLYPLCCLLATKPTGP